MDGLAKQQNPSNEANEVPKSRKKAKKRAVRSTKKIPKRQNGRKKRATKRKHRHQVMKGDDLETIEKRRDPAAEELFAQIAKEKEEREKKAKGEAEQKKSEKEEERKIKNAPKKFPDSVAPSWYRKCTKCGRTFDPRIPRNDCDQNKHHRGTYQEAMVIYNALDYDFKYYWTCCKKQDEDAAPCS